MPNTPHIFADRLMNIALTGPLLRLELATLQTPLAEGQKPHLSQSQTLVMPLDGFLASFGMMESMVKKLIDEGVIKKAPLEATNQISPE